MSGPEPNRYYVRAVWHHEDIEYSESRRIDQPETWPSPIPDAYGVYYTDDTGFDHWTEDHGELANALAHVRRVNP